MMTVQLNLSLMLLSFLLASFRLGCCLTVRSCEVVIDCQKALNWQCLASQIGSKLNFNMMSCPQIVFVHYIIVSSQTFSTFANGDGEHCGTHIRQF